jgi:hypothetical protein
MPYILAKNKSPSIAAISAEFMMLRLTGRLQHRKYFNVRRSRNYKMLKLCDVKIMVMQKLW